MHVCVNIGAKLTEPQIHTLHALRHDPNDALRHREHTPIDQLRQMHIRAGKVNAALEL